MAAFTPSVIGDGITRSPLSYTPDPWQIAGLGMYRGYIAGPQDSPQYLDTAPGEQQDIGPAIDLGPSFTPASLTAGGTLPDSFFNAIIAAEGTGKRGNPYDEVLGYGKYGRPSTPVSQLTIAQAIQAGEAIRKSAKNPHNSSAIGAFQITAQNLRTAIREWGFDPNAPFNAQTQKAIATKIYEQQGLKAWAGFKSHPQAKAVARQAASGATAVASAPPMPTPRPASYNPAQTQSLMAALGVAQQPAAEPVQRVSGLDRFNDPALGFAPTPAPSPAVLAANAEAMPSIPRPPSSIPNPTPRPTYNANQPVPPSPPDMPTQKEYRYTALPSGPLTPPPSLPNPTTPSAGNGSFSVDDFKQAMRDAGKAIGEDPAAVEQVLQRWDEMNAGMPAMRQRADQNLAAALAGPSLGQGGIGSDVVRGGTTPSYSSPAQPRAVATTTVAPPAGGFEPPLASLQPPATAYDPFNTRTTGKDQSRMAEYATPSAPPSSGAPGLVSPAQAASIPSITVHPLADTVAKPASWQDSFPSVGGKYQALTGADIPTVAGLGFGGMFPTAPAVQPTAAPKPAAAVPAYANQPLTNPARTRMANIPTVTRQQAQQLAQKIAAAPGGIGGFFQKLGSGTLPTMAGPNTAPGNTYTTPSGQSFDVTPGSHGSYMASPSGQIYSPSEYIDRMQGSGGWY